jgi:hypothetical protein
MRIKTSRKHPLASSIRLQSGLELALSQSTYPKTSVLPLRCQTATGFPQAPQECVTSLQKVAKNGIHPKQKQQQQRAADKLFVIVISFAVFAE